MNNIFDFDGDAVLNLTKAPNIPISKYPELTEHMDIPFEEIMLPWPDFEAPKVKISFWETLHKFVKGKGWKSICIHCAAGHGRTGTALSSLLIANAGYSANDAVDLIRHHYCEDAVESPSQCSYLQVVDYYYNDNEIKEESAPIPSIFINLTQYNESGILVNDFNSNKKEV